MFFMNANVKQGLLHWSSMQSRKGGKKVSIHSINANNVSNKDLCIGILLLLLSHFSLSDSVRPHRQQPTRLPHPWNSPGKNTGVGCHFLLQCKKVKSESEVSQSCLTLSDPMDCSLPGSSIHGIFQARVLEWSAIAFSAFYWRTIQKALMEEAFVLFLKCKIPDTLLWRFEPQYHT